MNDLNKIINHIETMRLDAEQRIQRIEEAEDNKDLIEYFKGVKNTCKTLELYIRRLESNGRQS